MPSSPKRHDLAILLVSYNVGPYIQRCLESLHTYLNGIDYIVSVVDNASKDDSIERIRALNMPLVLTPMEKNIGFGRGINRAARAVEAHYYLILNPDTIITNNIISDMIRTLRACPDLALIGCPMVNERGVPQASLYRLPSVFQTFVSLFEIKRLLRFVFLRKVLWRLNPSSASYLIPPVLDGSVTQVSCVPGSAFIIRSEDFQRIAGFDEKIFLYMEDCDLFLRIRKEGRGIALLKKDGIVHFVSKSFTQSFSSISPYKYWSTLYYFRKHGSYLSYQTVRAILLCSSLLKYLTKISDRSQAKYRHDALDVIKMCLFGFERFDPFHF
jgi:GT2 family glycosyltransferase